MESGAEHATGVTWEIDPSFGTGTYWYHAIDAGCAVCSFEMSFNVSETITCPTPPFLCLGAYNRSMTPYFGLARQDALTTVLGYAWDSPRYTQLLRPGGMLGATSIIMLPDAVKRMAPALECAAEELRGAPCAVDGTAPAPELARVLAEVARACGFKRQGSFSEAFRERFGCTPRAFRAARKVN